MLLKPFKNWNLFDVEDFLEEGSGRLFFALEGEGDKGVFCVPLDFSGFPFFGND